MIHIMKKIFVAFEENEIKYLHFKSNINLDDSFTNKGDFDVLADKNRITDIEQIIGQYNGRRHNPVRYGNYPGVDNWLIFDENTGAIYHLHLHYQLATGKALLKEYIIPWNALLFDTRVKDCKYNIYITDPNLEIILLTIRSVLKSKPMDWFRARIGCYHLHDSLNRERKSLQNKVDWDTVKMYLRKVFSDNEAEKLMIVIKKEKVSSKDFRQLTKIVRREMYLNRRYDAIVSNILTSYYRIMDLKNKFMSRKCGKCKMLKKTCLSGGLIIAFVGVDGSGKSTITKEINNWIGKKIECKRFYMGTGDGKTTVFASVMKKINKIISANPQVEMISNRNLQKLSLFKNPKRYLRKFAKLFLIYDVEKNNSQKIKMMQRYRLNGGISLLDRYPQIEMEGQNDGPKVCIYERMFGETWFIKMLKAKEAKQLSIVKRVIPDIIFRLNISAETSMSRKPEQTDIDSFRQKINDLNKITYQNALIVDIDAEQPYEKEILQIKCILWRYI